MGAARQPAAREAQCRADGRSRTPVSPVPGPVIGRRGFCARPPSSPPAAFRTSPWPSASDNVTTQSSDAFGRSVGSERSGLYNSENVRGFDPVDAGNVRLEGLYFDLVDIISPRLVQGSTIRIGPAALGYPFPAPTGLVDYALRKPDEAPGYSLTVEEGGGSLRGHAASLEFKRPIGERLGVAAGLGWRDALVAEGSRYGIGSTSVLVSWRPAETTEVLLFGGSLSVRDDEAKPTLLLPGSTAPPRIQRGLYLGQDWATRNSDTWLVGSVIKAPLRGARIEMGLVRSAKTSRSAFSDLLSGVAADGSAASHRIIADAGSTDASLSGELRLIKVWSGAGGDHRLIASLRGRARDRLFGGRVSLDLGPTDVLAPHPVAEPSYAIGPKNRDRVRQRSVGLSYSMVSRHGLNLDAGIAMGRYRKSIDYASAVLTDPVTSDRPLTWNLGGSYRVGPGLSAYAGVTRGREEALAAPDNAINRGEVPPAITTRQVEAGIKSQLAPGLTLIAGVFAINKPYYGLDPEQRYRLLGSLDNRGIELSLAGRLAPGWTLVGGTMLLDPRISGEAIDAGLVGRRPVGQVRRRSVVNLDWRTGDGQGPLSLDLSLESLSARTGNAANLLDAPARTVVNLGARYRFKLAGGAWLVRPQLFNAFGVYGWNVSPGGGWTYIPPRSAALQIVSDF